MSLIMLLGNLFLTAFHRGTFLLLLSLGLLSKVRAVDRSKFKSCEDSKFCQRHRHLKAGENAVFHVLPDTVKVDGSRVAATLNRTSDNRHFSLSINGLTDGRLRVVVDEASPIRPRFVASDALDGEPKELDFKSPSHGSGSLSLLTGDGNKIVLHYRPFRVDVYTGTQDLVVSLNAQSLLKIWQRVTGALFGAGGDSTAPERQDTEDNDNDEHTEQEVVTQDEVLVDEQEHMPDDNVQQADSVQAEEPAEEGSWSETWKSHYDAKPRGPSSVGMDVTLVGFQHVFGLPEHGDSFALKTTTNTDPYRLYNLDVFEYELNNPMALYGSVPYVVAHSETKTCGVLWLNAAETWVDIRSSTADKGVLRSIVDKFASSSEIPQVDTHWISESGRIDVFLFLGPTPKDLFRQYSKLTGVTPIPPQFSIAYHQCRWNYNDQEDVASVDANFDKNDIPYDVIWLDIEHTDGKKYFTWDSQKFPDPVKMQNDIAAKLRKMVVIVDPHIKKDNNYHVYKEAADKGYFVKDRDGNDYEGHCWPGASMYLDFLNPEVRDYWAAQFSLEKYVGSTENLFVWNDMNEPSVFSGPEITMHKDAKHFGDWEHRDVHNLYGFYQHMSTHDGLLARSGGAKRPFVLTRALFAGSQRYSAVWTGDNAALWSHLQASVPMLLSLSVAGVPFVGADVGGFFGNPDEELLVRWYQAAAHQPFFRAHAHLDTRRREPWLFSKDGMGYMRQAIRRRYMLLPYWYTLFYEHTLTGLPPMRPMWLEFPQDKSGFDEDRQWFIGSALLVRPVMDAGATSVSMYLPGKDSIYYDWDTMRAQPGPGAMYVNTPMDKIPVHIRGGTIVPLRLRPRRSSKAMQHDPLSLVIALNLDKSQARGTIYMDDGETYEYRKGQFLYRKFEYKAEGRHMASISSSNLNDTGKLETDVVIEKITIMGLGMYVEDVHLYYEDYKAEPLEFDFRRETMSLVIKKPGTLVHKDWRIDLHA